MKRQLKVLFYEPQRLKRLSPNRVISEMATKDVAKLSAVITAVRSSPIGSFSGGGYWEAMHGAMSGIHEIRITGQRPWLFRFFCLVNREQSQIVVFAAAKKRRGELISAADYDLVLDLAEEARRETSRPSE